MSLVGARRRLARCETGGNEVGEQKARPYGGLVGGSRLNCYTRRKHEKGS